jgi:dTDP-4-dehydrorhamnose 3,5-epimerase
MENNKLILIKPTRHKDERGFFTEIYNSHQYKELGINTEFVQENQSLSWNVGTLRGLHFQLPPYGQGKLVHCVRGAVFDVALDIRKGSPTFGHWKGYELTSENGYQLYVPIGFAHGFMTLEPASEIIYKCTNYYAPKTEGCIRWDDPTINVEWPVSEKIVLNERDAIAPLLKDFQTPFTFGENS